MTHLYITTINLVQMYHKSLSSSCHVSVRRVRGKQKKSYLSTTSKILGAPLLMDWFNCFVHRNLIWSNASRKSPLFRNKHTSLSNPEVFSPSTNPAESPLWGFKCCHFFSLQWRPSSKQTPWLISRLTSGSTNAFKPTRTHYVLSLTPQHDRVCCPGKLMHSHGGPTLNRQRWIWMDSVAFWWGGIQEERGWGFFFFENVTWPP